MKSVSKKLSEASELATCFRITNDDLVTFECSPHFGLRFHVRKEAFVRLFRDLKVPRSKLDLSADNEGNIHGAFTARGYRFSCCVLNEQVTDWQSKIDAARHDVIEVVASSRPRIKQAAQLCLPAPIGASS